MTSRDLPPSLARVRLVHEAGSWAAFIPDSPLSGTGISADEATADLVVALREYASDWHARLRLAPNHRSARALVESVRSTTDDRLRALLLEMAASAG